MKPMIHRRREPVFVFRIDITGPDGTSSFEEKLSFQRFSDQTIKEAIDTLQRSALEHVESRKKNLYEPDFSEADLIYYVRIKLKEIFFRIQYIKDEGESG